MSAIIGRTALRATPRLQSAFRPTQRLRDQSVIAEDKSRGQDALKKGARRDPELIVLFVIMSGVFGLAGWHFSRNPTSSSSENPVAKAVDSEPWKSGTTGKYQYHPGGDTNVAKKDAPSALNTVIIPNVNLPKSLHDQFNKWGKDGY